MRHGLQKQKCFSKAKVGNESLVVTDNINKDKVILDYEQLELKELVTKEDIDNGKHIKRMYEEEESLSHAVYLNEDGTRTAYYFMHPVKYKDSKGNVKDISLELKEDSKGNFISAQSDVIATFPKNLNEGISLEKAEDDILLTMHPVENSEEEVRTKANEYLVQYTYDENTIIEYELTYTGIKENIIVEKYTGQTEYSFVINTNGLKLIEDERTLLLVDDKNNVKSVVGDVIIYTEDNVNNTFGDLSYKTIKENETYLITIHVDEEFLLSSRTKYPIVIDPTIEINSNSGTDAISDVTINSAAGSSGSSTYLYAGKRNSVGN